MSGDVGASDGHAHNGVLVGTGVLPRDAIDTARCLESWRGEKRDRTDTDSVAHVWLAVFFLQLVEHHLHRSGVAHRELEVRLADGARELQLHV